MARVLLIAPTCDGTDVGEAWVAFQWASRLAQRHELTLLTYSKRGHDRVATQLPGVRVVEWREPVLLGRAERFNSMLKPGYIPFYVRARRWIRRALADGERFDVVHQAVPVAMRYPCPATGLGIPVVFGPVGGSLESPAGFGGDEDTAAWYVGLRSVDRFRLRRDPLLRRTYEQADRVLGIAPYVVDNLAELTLQSFEVMGETGLAALPAPVERAPHTATLKLLFVGRLIRTKGARDAIAAMDRLRDLDVGLDIVGDGFDRAACEELVARLELGTVVRFHGQQSKAEVAQHYARSDVFVFPSFREPGGNVMFEAMGAGLPQIVSTAGGPGFVVDDSCGIRIAAHDPEQYAAAIADAVRRLAGDPALRLQMGQAAYARLAQIGLWSSKIDRIGEVYDEVIAARASSQAG